MKEISAGGIVYTADREEVKILMIEDRNQRWTLPKGKVEKGEFFPETAIREIYEETGIKGRIIKKLDTVHYEYYQQGLYRVEKDVHYYLIEALDTNITVQESEINSAQWLTLEEAWERQKLYGYDNNLKVIEEALKELGFTSF